MTEEHRMPEPSWHEKVVLALSFSALIVFLICYGAGCLLMGQSAANAQTQTEGRFETLLAEHPLLPSGPTPSPQITTPEYERRLRDWYAGQALAGILATDGDKRPPRRRLHVEVAWEYANAMMVERKRLIEK